DGAAGGAQRSEPASGEGRLYDFGNTSEAAGGPSTTAPPPPSTTTTTTPPTTTTTTPSTTAPPAVGVQGGPTAGHVAAVVELTNDARRRAGCGELVVDDRLVAAAQAHSDDMAAQGYFSHTSLDGRSFADRIRAAGYPSPGGENIARGQRSAAEVVAAWMDSPGHRANILNCSFRAIGVGLHEGTWTWTQVFGRWRCVRRPLPTARPPRTKEPLPQSPNR